MLQIKRSRLPRPGINTYHYRRVVSLKHDGPLDTFILLVLINFNFMLHLYLPAAAPNWQIFFFLSSTAKIAMNHLGVFVCPKFEGITAFYVRTCMSLHIFHLFACMFSCIGEFNISTFDQKNCFTSCSFSTSCTAHLNFFFSPARLHVLNQMHNSFMLRTCVRLCACLRDNRDWRVTLQGILSCWERKRRQRERQPAELQGEHAHW